ncbi:hypothetical protein HYS30_03945, partial [Candidatus Peregrinibacteria bacterium]|nr:hypothetical protein [Candidatus Peregrinibacteria bacterium]
MLLATPPHRQIASIRDYLDNAQGGGELKGAERSTRQQWTHEALARAGYENLSREDRGFVRQYLQRVTGYSRAAIERHISAYREEAAQMQSVSAIANAAGHGVEHDDRNNTPAVPAQRLVVRALHGWQAALMISAALVIFGHMRGSDRFVASTINSRVADNAIASNDPTPGENTAISAAHDGGAPSWLGIAPDGDFRKRIAERRNGRRQAYSQFAPAITANEGGLRQRLATRREERLQNVETPADVAEDQHASAPTHSEYQTKLVASLINIAGIPGEGKVVVFKNGKATWGDPPASMLHAGGGDRPSGTGRKPAGDGSTPAAYSSGGGNRGGGGGNTVINNTTTGLDAIAGDLRYLNSDGDTIDGNFTIGDASTDVLRVRSRISGSLIPTITNTYDLGTSSMRWRSLYLSGGTLYLGSDGNEATIRYNDSTDSINFDTNNDGRAEMTLGNTSGFAFSGATTFNQVAYTWPSANGSNGQVLTTAGNGTLSWTSAGTGLSQASGDSRYVNVSGDSMTGGLLIQSAAAGVTPATIDAGLLLEVIGTASGRILHAQDVLRSSGSLIVQSAGLFKGNLTTRGTASGSELYASALLRSSGSLSVQGATVLKSTLKIGGVTYTFPAYDGSASGKVLKTDSAGTLSWSTDAGSAYYAGQGLSLNGSSAFSLSSSFSGSALEIMGTSSGRQLHANDQLRSSGT